MIVRVLHRSDALYFVKDATGESKYMDEKTLLSEQGGLAAFDKFCSKGTKVLGRKEPKTLENGPCVKDRVAVLFNKKWSHGTVIDCALDAKSKPVYTIEYDDGFTIGPDRLKLPWQLRSPKKKLTKSLVKSLEDEALTDEDWNNAWLDAMKEIV